MIDFRATGVPYSLLVTCILGLTAVISSEARGDQYGEWRADVQGPGSLGAATFSESGAVFGQFCYPEDEKCVWSLAIKTGCREGLRYQVLVNSDGGAFPAELKCSGVLKAGLYRYDFTEFSTIERAVRRGTRLGFAFPLYGDQFMVFRFSLDGVESALSVLHGAMLGTFGNQLKKGKPKGDLIL